MNAHRRYLLASLSVALGCNPQASSSARLFEVSAIAVPEGFVPAGAVLTDGGTVVAWSAQATLVLRLRGRTVEAPCGDRALVPIGAAVVGHDSIVEILSIIGAGRQAVVWRASGVSVCRQHYSLGTRGVVAAARLDGGWVTATRDREGQPAIIGHDTLGRVTWAHAADTGLGSPLNPVRSFLTATGLGVTMASATHPFRSTYFDSEGRRHLDLQADESADSTHVRWVGLRLLHVPGGYLQVLADPSSDRRQVVSLDSFGTVTGRRDMDVALGLMATSPSGGRVLAFRRTDIDEVVEYRIERAFTHSRR